MKLISVNTGGPRDIEADGQVVRTSIWKSPRAGRLQAMRLNIEGDQQSDLAVHGGPYKAVYCYPSEHYAYWRAELPGVELPLGMFGENLTMEGLLETDVFIGDRISIGTAQRMACTACITRTSVGCFIAIPPWIPKWCPTLCAILCGWPWIAIRP